MLGSAASIRNHPRDRQGRTCQVNQFCYFVGTCSQVHQGREHQVLAILQTFVFAISYSDPGFIHLWMSDYHPDGAALSQGFYDGSIMIMHCDYDHQLWSNLFMSIPMPIHVKFMISMAVFFSATSTD